MTTPVCIDDVRLIALDKLPKNARDYYESGSEEEETLRDNVAAFSRIKMRPRVLKNVKEIDLSTTILGEKISMPICIAPSAMQKLAHPEGENGTAAATRATNTVMCLSTYSTTNLDEVIAPSCGKPANGIYWFQLYVYENRETSEWIIRKAEQAGYKALVVTVDTPVLGRRRKDLRNKFHLPPHLSLANFDAEHQVKSQSERISTSPGSSASSELEAREAAKKAIDALGSSEIASRISNTSDMGMCWEKDIPWLKSVTNMKIVLKGIMTGEDAVLAAK
ncbi:Hydroxyacid oxidase 1, partial [Blyttiomyces sp. JEL0837]